MFDLASGAHLHTYGKGIRLKNNVPLDPQAATAQDNDVIVAHSDQLIMFDKKIIDILIQFFSFLDHLAKSCAFSDFKIKQKSAPTFLLFPRSWTIIR